MKLHLQVFWFWKLLILHRNQKGFLLIPVYKHLEGIYWYGMAWYGMSLLLVTTTQNQSFAFSFELLKVLVALHETDTILRFEISNAVGYRGKLVRLYLPRNFSLIEMIWSLFHASENVKLVPLELIEICASELYCKKRILAR